MWCGVVRCGAEWRGAARSVVVRGAVAMWRRGVLSFVRVGSVLGGGCMARRG